jgi:protocatechuate 3,4-dioxygenase beta subunit
MSPTRLAPRRPRLRFEPLEAREVPASLAGRVILDFDNSGTATGPDTGITGVTLTLSGGGLTTPLTTTTDAQGNFSFSNVAAGTYTLTETPPTAPANQAGKVTAGTAPGTASAASHNVTNIVLGASTAATGYTFAQVPLVSTGGAVFEDTNGNGIKDAGEAGIPNVTITLSGVSAVTGTITPKTATTDASGNYTFTGLTPGTYMIAETQPTGFSDGPDHTGTPAASGVANDRFMGIDLTKSAATSGGFNFGEVRGGTLSGVVFKDANNDGIQAATGEPGIAGVTVRLTGTDGQGHSVDKTTTTDAAGAYTFDNLKAGTYSVQEVQPKGFFDGTDKAGTSGGTVGSDKVTGIQFAAGATATGYTFAEQPRADLVLAQTPGTAAINPNGTVTITYTLRNKGTATATASTVVVNFGGMTFVSASTPSAFNSTTKTWTVGDLAAGQTQTIRLTLRGPVDGTFAPSAHAATTGTELSTKNNNSASTITVGVVTPPAPAPTSMSAFWANLVARFNQYNPLTRLWLFQRFFG